MSEGALAGVWDVLATDAGRDLVDVASEEILVARTMGILEVNSQEEGKPLASYAGLPPKEAIAFFRGKRIVGPGEFRKMSDQAKRQAFSVAGLQQRYAVAEAHEVLARGIEEGASQAAVVKQLREVFGAAGLAAPSRYHLNTVFRNATQGAYADGRWQQMKRVATRRPFWRYMTVGDENVRPAHAAMHGRVYRHTDPIWQTWYPPNGHNCRCRVESLREPPEGESLTEVPEAKPDPGWEGSPAPAQAIEAAQRRLDQYVTRAKLLRPPKVATTGRKVHSYPGDLGPGQAVARARKADRIAGLTPSKASALLEEGEFVITDAPKRLRGTQRAVVAPLPSNLDLAEQIVDRIGSDPSLRHLVSRIELSNGVSYARGKTLTPHLVSSGDIVRGTDATLTIVAKDTDARALAQLLLGVERGNPLTMRSALDLSPVYLRGVTSAPGYESAVLNWRKQGRRVLVRLTKDRLPGFNAEKVLVTKARAESLT